jgi:hypothetical protein
MHLICTIKRKIHSEKKTHEEKVKAIEASGQFQDLTTF